MSQNYVVLPAPHDDQFQFVPLGPRPFIRPVLSRLARRSRRENLSIHKPWAGQNRFLERVFQVEKFKHRYLGALEGTRCHACRPERFAGQVDESGRRASPLRAGGIGGAACGLSRWWRVRLGTQRFGQWLVSGTSTGGMIPVTAGPPASLDRR